MITARSAYQIYKDTEKDGTISAFNSLPTEAFLPYKIEAAEEVLVGSLDFMESASNEDRSVFAVSTLHAAVSYLSLFASYTSLQARSQALRRITINYDALIRAVTMFGNGDASLVSIVKQFVVGNASLEPITPSSIVELESAFNTLEKHYRQEAKESGQVVQALRKKPPVSSHSPAKVRSTDKGPSPARGLPDAIDSGEKAVNDTVYLTHPETSNGSLNETSSLPLRKGGNKNGPKLANGKRTTRSLSNGTNPEEPILKIEKLEVASTGNTKNAATASAKHRSNKSTSSAPLVVFGRLRALTTGEKKVVAALNQVILVLAHVYATQFNDLIIIFDHLQERISAIQSIIDKELEAYNAKEDKKPPEPFHEVELRELRAALDASAAIFRQEPDRRYELDEDLLYPIAYACLKIINQIEGYNTAPFCEPTDEEKEAKRAARVAAKVKRDEAEQKSIEKAKAKEAMLAKKNEERHLLRQFIEGITIGDQLVEDTEIVNPAQSAFVQYELHLPLEPLENFQKALSIWTMLVSIPQTLCLSRMPFSLFLKGLHMGDQDNNGLMEEITRCLLDVCMEQVRNTSPSLPRMSTRGKNWFEAMVEFVALASGNKQQRNQRGRHLSHATESDKESENDEDSDSETSSEASPSFDGDTSEEEESDDEKSEAGSGSAQQTRVKKNTDDAKVPPSDKAEDEVLGFDKELKTTMEHITELRVLATWGNLSIEDRLNLLNFLVREVLSGTKARKEAEELLKMSEKRVTMMEKRLREIREEAEKEVKNLLKAFRCPPPNGEKETDNLDAKDYEIRRAKILKDTEKKRHEVYMDFYQDLDKTDVGSIIQPLGMDRYRRMYWRFPFNRDVHVQTIDATVPDFPILPEPEEFIAKKQAFLLFDNEEDLSPSHFNLRREQHLSIKSPQTMEPNSGDKGPSQRHWGTIPAYYLPSFVKGLDWRGEREARLRKALEEFIPYSQSANQSTSVRITRSRAHALGYVNHLKVSF
ncbi:unnamed protein product [Phytomonas sp. EM1]|nr:unnamed protein product [Phytomonas sp. EM1]|eukprot:CCW59984.1 unnamed protein product [Phytomonas sp. isolate EM1]